MYYEYWSLHKPPFDNVPDPGMYVDCHVSLESAISETLFAIEEGNECLAVIVGDVGLGKTLSIRLIIDSLAQEKYRIALVTNPGVSFIQLLREIIGQLTGSQCDEKRKSDLLELFNRVLFETADASKKVLIFIDEANAISPANLESLRLLTNMQDDCRNLFTIILVGQMELARRLEKRANLSQRIGTFRVIEKIPSPEMVKAYVETRLGLAGGSAQVFTDDALGMLWTYSEHGVPRLINKIAKLCLKAGETNGLRQIDAPVVKEMGERFHNLSGRAAPKRKPRLRNDEPAVEEETASALAPDPGTGGEIPEVHSPETHSIDGVSEEAPDRQACITEPVVTESVEIRGVRVEVEIEREMLTESLQAPSEERLKSTGILAAKILKDHPELTAGPAVDPISVWSELRNALLERIERHEPMQSCPANAAVL